MPDTFKYSDNSSLLYRSDATSPLTPSVYIDLYRYSSTFHFNPECFDSAPIGNPKHLCIVEGTVSQGRDNVLDLDNEAFSNIVSLDYRNMDRDYQDNPKCPITISKPMPNLKYAQIANVPLSQTVIDWLTSSPNLIELVVIALPESPVCLEDPLEYVPTPSNRENIERWMFSLHAPVQLADFYAPKLKNVAMTNAYLYGFPTEIIKNQDGNLQGLYFRGNHISSQEAMKLETCLNRGANNLQIVSLAENPLIEPPMWNLPYREPIYVTREQVVFNSYNRKANIDRLGPRFGAPSGYNPQFLYSHRPAGFVSEEYANWMQYAPSSNDLYVYIDGINWLSNTYPHLTGGIIATKDKIWIDRAVLYDE